jgi:poly(3-hydroxybutyrate) depolymerase
MSDNTKLHIQNLPNLGVRDDTITISGFSSGAFMASNMHLIYSNIFKGCGMVSGGSFPWFMDIRKIKVAL